MRRNNMKIQYEQYYVEKADITIIMKAIINEKDEQIKYELSGYYFGDPSIYGLEEFKDNKGK
jgi:hypothetical protein